MKTKLCFTVITTVFAALITVNTVFAVDLIEVYKQAYENDQQFKIANAQWLADRENLSISRASLLPQLFATGSVNRLRADATGKTTAGVPFLGDAFHANKTAYALNLVQPIFNITNWANDWKASADVKAAEATFIGESQNLFLRTAQAYFDILQAKTTLNYTQAKKRAVGKQLEQTRRKYEVGVIAITDVETAQASYDVIAASEIAAQNELTNKIEQLSAITGNSYSDDFAILNPNISLLSPKPFGIDVWVKAAERQNFELLAAQFKAIVAKENIKAVNSGHLPTLNLTAGYSNDYNNNQTGYHDTERDKAAAVGLSVNMPLFQGGAVVAQSRQARHQYQQAVAQHELMHRNVVSQTRQAYLGVVSAISKIKADKQALKSNETALQATESAYSVGTRTIVDVLQAQTGYYDAQKNLAIDQYIYILQNLKLKKLTGILSAKDLQQINVWLTTNTHLNKPKKRSVLPTKVVGGKFFKIKHNNKAIAIKR